MAQKYFLSEENTFFSKKTLPGPSVQIFVIAQKIELSKCWGGAAASQPPVRTPMPLADAPKLMC